MKMQVLRPHSAAERNPITHEYNGHPPIEPPQRGKRQYVGIQTPYDPITWGARSSLSPERVNMKGHSSLSPERVEHLRAKRTFPDREATLYNRVFVPPPPAGRRPYAIKGCSVIGFTVGGKTVPFPSSAP